MESIIIIIKTQTRHVVLRSVSRYLGLFDVLSAPKNVSYLLECNILFSVSLHYSIFFMIKYINHHNFWKQKTENDFTNPYEKSFCLISLVRVKFCIM